MINGIKETFDVQVNDKIVIKTIAARLLHRVMTTSLWAIPK